MALKLVMETPEGFEVNYHRINGIHDYSKDGYAHIDVESYISQYAAQNNKSPVMICQYTFENEKYPFTAVSAKKEDAYVAIKTLDVFKDAENI